ncbi:hypothetical protein BSU04_21180 [Caballeronia sordidicola]|uniref:Uncharacterized protein n=1 Tax=Caballeronia sordidicola TaxID=196367 RepID=A0A226WZA7_CABSO|nr:hypothetical protein BSU04_21180 [Caballeronia sordidicola]
MSISRWFEAFRGKFARLRSPVFSRKACILRSCLATRMGVTQNAAITAITTNNAATATYRA